MLKWNGYRLSSFSIFNNLNYPVSKIKLLFIVYDESGVPTDYKFCTIFKYNEDVVLPGLAKKFSTSDKEDNEVHSLAKLETCFDAEKINTRKCKEEVRVLDYYVVKE